MEQSVDDGRVTRYFTLFVVAALLSPSPAIASDFTGIATFFASITGIVLLWVWGTLFGISRMSKRPKIRKWMPLAGLAIGITLSVWWVADPIAEGPAILLLVTLPFVALCIVGGD